MQTNVEFVQMLYNAFLDRRIDFILNRCSDTIAWECVGNPAWVPHAGAISGRSAVRRFFENLDRVYTFEIFSPDTFVAAGDQVFCLGHVQVRATATGETFDNRFIHIFRVDNNSRLIAFTEFADTAAIAVGAGTLRPTGESVRAA